MDRGAGASPNTGFWRSARASRPARYPRPQEREPDPSSRLLFAALADREDRRRFHAWPRSARPGPLHRSTDVWLRIWAPERWITLSPNCRRRRSLASSFFPNEKALRAGAQPLDVRFVPVHDEPAGDERGHDYRRRWMQDQPHAEWKRPRRYN